MSLRGQYCLIRLPHPSASNKSVSETMASQLKSIHPLDLRKEVVNFLCIILKHFFLCHTEFYVNARHLCFYYLAAMFLLRSVPLGFFRPFCFLPPPSNTSHPHTNTHTSQTTHQRCLCSYFSPGSQNHVERFGGLGVMVLLYRNEIGLYTHFCIFLFSCNNTSWKALQVNLFRFNSVFLMAE